MKIEIGHTMRIAAMLLLAGAGTALTAAPADSARDTYLAAREHLIEERLEPALGLFRTVVTEFPESGEADDAQFYIGYCLEHLGRNQEAIDAYENLIRGWPDSVRLESARSRQAELLASQESDESRATLEIFLESDASWEVKRDAAFAMARSGDLSSAGILEEAMRRESSGRQLELIRILGRHTDDPAARRILLIALEPSRSSSVQICALEVLAPVAGQGDVTEAIGNVIGGRNSSSVQIKAIQSLSEQVTMPRVRAAIARGLDDQKTSSVQILVCTTLEGHMLDPEVRPAVLELFRRSSASSVKLKALEALEVDRDRPEIAEVLVAAIGDHNSTSVQLKAVGIAGASKDPGVRVAISDVLAPENSTSVQMEAVKVLSSGENDPAAAEALLELMRYDSNATSVELKAVEALARHMDTPAAPRALALALGTSRSTSVQLKAVDLAARHYEVPEVEAALRGLLDDSDTSTSVQLRVVELLDPEASDPRVRAIIAAGLRHPFNSTSVNLRAVEALAPHADEADARDALLGTLTRQYSTSVVLRSMKALDGLVSREPAVRAGYVRLMEDDEISLTARVRAGQRLLDGADDRLRERIADAMEDVVVRANRKRYGGPSREITRDALDVLDQIDPRRADELAGRYR